MKKMIKIAAEKIHEIMKNNGDKYWTYGRSYCPSVKKISSVINWVISEIEKTADYNVINKEIKYELVNVVTVTHILKENEKHIWNIEYKNNLILNF